MRYRIRLNMRRDFDESGHPETYRMVRDLVAYFDPMDLVMLSGADEYSLEVYDIMANLSECRNHHDLRELFQEVFEHWFNLPPRHPESTLVTATDRVFAKLWDWMVENGGVSGKVA